MSVLDTTDGWQQVSLWCDDWRAAEQMAVNDLGPRLATAERAEVLTSWWFVRKAESWRVRYLPAPGKHEQATTLVDQAMRGLSAGGAIRRWAATIYEPEIDAFGGPDGIDIAHALFHADSRRVLDYLRQARNDHRRELGLVLATVLMLGAHLEWYEQGDVWAQVTDHRTTDRPTPSESAAQNVHQLITARDNSAYSTLAAVPEWPAAFQRAGEQLAELANKGRLTRGLRAVLAHHILFAWNRMGIPADVQGVLAGTAAHTIFHRELDPATALIPAPATPSTASLSAVTTDNTQTSTPGPEQLRAELVAYIRGRGTFRTPQVERAFLTLERHLFLPGVDLKTAYAPQVVVTKRAVDGSAISSASHPNLVATQLEDLDAHTGHRVLEIGAATGINAGLIAEVTGPAGKVVTIEIDDDLATGARASLAAAGYEQVEVICGDGAAGHPAGAPYDRIIVTAEAWDISAPWWQQLNSGGRIVVPLRLHGSGLTRSLALDLDSSGRLVSRFARVCGFVPMRGTDAHDDRILQLTPEVVLKLDARDARDEAALSQALTHPAHEHWTGLQVRDDEPVEHLDLWLAMNASRFSRLSVTKAARQSGLDPAPRWAGAALYDGGTIAYLAIRPRDNGSDELGVTAHGPDSDKVAANLLELLYEWDRDRPAQPIITAHPTDTLDEELSPGTLISRLNTRLTVSW
jgi:protein-L-isoaspartate(D-aspartate) O-methyltransferase